jgi:pimeloyl-ACP methyl ester carboxylesterase
MSRMLPESLVAGWQALMDWQGTELRAAQITASTLIIYGSHDAPALIEGSKRLSDLIPNSETVVIADAAHAPQEEKPEELNAALGDFLRRVDRRQ